MIYSTQAIASNIDDGSTFSMLSLLYQCYSITYIWYDMYVCECCILWCDKVNFNNNVIYLISIIIILVIYSTQAIASNIDDGSTFSMLSLLYHCYSMHIYLIWYVCMWMLYSMMW